MTKKIRKVKFLPDNIGRHLVTGFVKVKKWDTPDFSRISRKWQVTLNVYT